MLLPIFWIIENLLLALWIVFLSITFIIVNVFEEPESGNEHSEIDPSVAGKVYLTIFFTVAIIGFSGLFVTVTT